MKGKGTWVKTWPNDRGSIDIMGNCDKCGCWPCDHAYQDKNTNWHHREQETEYIHYESWLCRAWYRLKCWYWRLWWWTR